MILMLTLSPLTLSVFSHTYDFLLPISMSESQLSKFKLRFKSHSSNVVYIWEYNELRNICGISTGAQNRGLINRLGKIKLLLSDTGLDYRSNIRWTLANNTISNIELEIWIYRFYRFGHDGCSPKQSVVLSGLGVTLYSPIPLGRNTTPESKHVHRSEVKIFEATNSKLL